MRPLHPHRQGRNWLARRFRAALALTRLEDRTVPATVVNVAPVDQTHLLASAPLHTDTGSVDLSGKPTDFYMTNNTRIGLSRRDDQISVYLPGGSAELQQRLADVNSPLAGYTLLRTMVDHKTFILQGPAGSAANTLAQVTGTILGGWSGPVFVDVGSTDWVISTNEVVVRLFNDADAASLFNGRQFASYAPLPYMPHVYRAQLSGNDSAQALAAANSLILDDRVDWAAPNFYHALSLFFNPNDPLYPNQYHLKNTGQVAGYLAGADIGASLAWDKTTGTGKTIAIVDTGIDNTNPDLMPNLLAGKDFSNSTTGTVGTPTIDWHGTATAGLAAAAGNNGIGVAGVAFGAKILPARIFGDGTGTGTTDADIASALSYSYKNADVVSNSWGYQTDQDVSAVVDQALIDANAMGRGGKGTPMFFAAGNFGYVSFPATKSLTYSNVIAVGGATPRDTWRGYSSGSPVNIVAPTDDDGIGGTGTGIITTDRVGTDGYNPTPSPGGDYSDPNNAGTQFGGTSASSPIAAGVGALVLSLNNSLTAGQLRGYLMNTSSLIEGIYGQYDAKTGHSDFDGNGRVSASAAIAGLNKAEIDVSIIGQDIASGSTVNFIGAVDPDTSSDGTFYIRNQGDQTLNLTDLKLAGSADFSITTGFTDSVTGKATSALTVGQAAYFTIRFTPTSGAPRTGTVTITNNDADEGSYVINLAGDAQVRSISGTIFRDADNSASYNSLIDTPIGGQLAYLDVNNNGIFDSTTTKFAGTTGGVPDGDPNGISFTTGVSGLTESLYALKVNVDISMMFDGDLSAFLIAPSGQTINLWSNVGAGGVNFTGTILDDSADISINAGQAPFTGSFQPVQPLSTFLGLTGASLNGTWSLHLVDDASGFAATVNTWSLEMTTTTDIPAVSNAKGQYAFFDLTAGSYTVRSDVPSGFFATVPAAGKYVVTVVNADDTFPGRDFGRLEANSISGKVFHDHNGDATIEAGDDGLANRTVFLDLNDNGTLDIAVGSPQTFTSSTPVDIPDNSINTSVISVSGIIGRISNVKVQLDITHTWDGDLDIYLQSPAGTKINLSHEHGGSGQNYQGTIFDDAATTPISAGSTPYAGSYQPDQPLATYNSGEPNGNWTLYVDDTATYDTGTLNSWSLILTPETGEVHTTTDAKGNYIFLDQLAGSYTIRTIVPTGWNILNPVGPPVGKNTGSFMTGGAIYFKNFGEALQNAIYGNTYLDVNRNGTLDTGDTPISNVTIYDDANNNGVFNINASKNSGPGSVGMVADNNPTGVDLTVNVSGYSNFLNSLKVNFDATMTYDGDIQATLISPGGTTIALFTNVGAFGQNFTGTIFDDSAAVSIDAGLPPYTGSFQPEQPLSTFKGLTGANLNGTWKLHLVDVAFGDTMTVNSWSLDIATGEMSAVSDANGNYIFSGLSTGKHNIRRITPAGLLNAEPVGDVYAINLALNQTVQNNNFGQVIPQAAKLSSITVNGAGAGGAQRSMVTNLKVTFDSHVTFVGGDANAAAAFTLTNQKTSLFPTLAAAVDNSGVDTVVTLTWTGMSVDTGMSLADGRYTLTIKAAQFGGFGFDGNGNGVAEGSPTDDYVEVGAPGFADNLFRLFGDSDGNGVVNNLDFLAFRSAFGGTSFTFDVDGNGTVNTVDFLRFRSSFGNSV